MIAALCAGMAVFFLVPKSAQGRCHRIFSAKRRGPAPQFPPALVGTVLVVSGVALILPVPMNLVVAAVAAPVTWRFISQLESRSERRRRLALERQLPGGIDLLVAVLEAGRPPSSAFAAVGRASADPIGNEFTRIASRLAVSGDEMSVWTSMQDNQEFAALGRSFARAARSGMSVAQILARLADDLRRNRRSASTERARSVGVSAAAPLGLCFLPAFFLIGIAPAIIGTFKVLVL